MANQDGHILLFKIYIAGVRVPFTSATIESSPNMPSRASVSLPPSPALNHCRDKTPCEIFWFDEREQQWKLLFEGLMAGDGASKETESRSATMVFDGISKIYYQAFLHLYQNNSGLGYGTKVAIAVAGGSELKEAMTPRQVQLLYANLLKRPDEGDSNIPDAFTHLLTKITKFNDFFQRRGGAFRAAERLAVLPDNEIANLVKNRAGWDKIFNSHAAQIHSSYSSVMQLIATMASFIYYDWIEVPSPLNLNSQIIFKPANFFTVPPKCNVVFPARSTYLSTSRNFAQEPTRVYARLYTTRRPQNIKASTRFKLLMSPPELQKAFEASLLSKSTPKENSEQLNHLTNNFLTEEEKYRGVIPKIIDLNTPEWATTAQAARADSKAGTIDPSSINVLDPAALPDQVEDEYIRQLIEYKHTVSRFENRDGTFSHVFNPFAVAGFPMLIPDAAFPMYGYCKSIIQQFTPKAGTTTFGVGYARRVGEPGAFAPLPTWINSAYTSGAAGAALLGSAPIFGGSRTTSGGEFSEAAARLWREAKNAEDGPGFAYNYNRRPLVTEEEWASFIGASGSQGPDGEVQVYNAEAFLSEDQAIMKAHLQFVSKDAQEGF